MRVLAAYMETGDSRYANAWLDYVFNIRGKRIIGFSRGLRSVLGFDDFKDFSDDDERSLYDGDLLMVRLDDVQKITMEDWYNLAADVDGGDLDSALQFLNRMQISYDVIGDGLNKYRGMLDCRMSCGGGICQAN